MIAAHHNYVLAIGVFDPRQEIEVLLPGVIGRVANIKYVARHDEYVYGFLTNRLQQPIQRQLLLFSAVAVVEPVAQMPIGSVEDAHGANIRNTSAPI